MVKFHGRAGKGKGLIPWESCRKRKWALSIGGFYDEARAMLMSGLANAPTFLDGKLVVGNS